MIILGHVRFSKCKLCPAGLGKRFGWGLAGSEPLVVAKNRKKQNLKLFSIILDPALNQEVSLIQISYSELKFFLPQSLSPKSSGIGYVCYIENRLAHRVKAPQGYRSPKVLNISKLKYHKMILWVEAYNIMLYIMPKRLQIKQE